jgi:glyoxylase-like metal-dependent hydrolase (beta-lactamase superfamily II)
MIDVKCFPLGPLQTNCFLASKGNRALVVDPGGDPQTLLEHLHRQELQVDCILNTHFHFDHILGNKALQDATGAPILASQEDDFLLQSEVGSGGGMFGFPKVEAFAYESIEPGERDFLGETCRILPTPGHTPGSLSYYFPESALIFSGDVLFQRSIGRTDFPKGDTKTLLAAIRDKIFTLPPETRVFSGHGPETTVGDEKKFNPFFQEGFL